MSGFPLGILVANRVPLSHNLRFSLGFAVSDFGRTVRSGHGAFCAFGGGNLSRAGQVSSTAHPCALGGAIDAESPRTSASMYNGSVNSSGIHTLTGQDYAGESAR